MTDTASSAFDISFEELAQIAVRVASAAGDRVLALRTAGVDVSATKSSAVDVVTAADREAERMISEALLEARPDDGMLGEEGTGRESRSGITWVVDPIDGTVNYLYNIPAYAVSIAATVEDPNAYADGRRPVAGAVVIPSTGEVFHAWEGGGAFLNGQPIRVSQPESLALSLVGTGFGYTVERRTEQAAVVAGLLPRVRDIRRIGSAAYDLCLLAAGRIDAYYERGLNPWDYAAGVVIASEAGALVLGRDDESRPGQPYMFVGSPSVVQQLRDAVIV